MIRKMLVTTTTLALAFVLALPAFAGRGDDAKRKSKNGKTEGAIAGVQVVVEYGRPSVAGRAIWGALVPYGKIWRTGADEATTISFSKDVLVQGQKLAAGTYALFTIPGEKEWTVVFNKTAEQWGAYDYDEKQDALRVTAQPGRVSTPTESLDFVIQDDDVVMRWENVTVGFAVQPAG